MKKFYQKKSFRILGIIIAALIMGTVIAAVSHSTSSPLSSAVIFITKPLQKISTSLSESIESYCSYFRSSESLKRENGELRQKIADYQSEVAELEDAKRTIELYEEFLGVKEEHPDYKFASASILSKDTADVYGSFTIDKGKNKNIKVNDPVIYGKNLVGIVTDVTEKNATVKTILSPDFSAAVYETRSNYIGYVEGFDDGIKDNVCKMPGLSKESNVASGGVVYTLGIGGVFPKDLIVGTISEISKSKSDVSYYAEIESNINISEITDVFVITSFEGQGMN